MPSILPIHYVRLLGLAVLGLLAAPLTAHAITLPAGFTQSTVASGLSQTIAMAFAPDGRLFVCEKGGTLRVIENGILQPTPFLTVPNVETVGSDGSNGLLGVVFDPAFVSNGYFYVHYTVKAMNAAPAHNRISRFTSNGATADPASEQVLLELPDISVSGHYGGDMKFADDGTLLIAIGMYDSPSSAQSLSDVKGKILRINTDPANLIPEDNPFVDEASGTNRAIWALGLRNPFTFALDPLTGRMYINDVGELKFEEINEGAAAANYGWPESEGPSGGYVSPVHYYGRNDGCALTAGTFYSMVTPRFPAAYNGKYFFADWCKGWIRVLDPQSPAAASAFATGAVFPMDLELGPDGSLYYIQWHDSAVYRIDYSAAPVVTTVAVPNRQVAYTANSSIVALRAMVSASGSMVTGGQVTFQVTRGDVPIGGPYVAPVANGVASVNYVLPAATPAGIYSIDASYGGTDAYLQSAGTGQVEVTRAATKTSLASSPKSPRAGAPVTFTATIDVVAPSAGVPDGTVDFYDGTTLLSSQPVDAGRATLTTSLAKGPHQIRAEYSGSSNFAPSASSAPNKKSSGSNRVKQ